MSTLTKTSVRTLLGRGAFTATEYARMTVQSTGTARKEIRRLIDEGVLEELDETRKHLDRDGLPQRGRPARLFRVTP